MCIPFNQGPPMIRLNPKGENLKTTMTVIVIIHIILATLKMFILNPFASVGDIISCMVLWCGVQQHNFCNVLMYMIFCLFDSFQLATTIAFLIQTGAFGPNSPTASSSQVQGRSSGLNMGFIYGFTIVMFIFYVIAVYCSFQTYKEFKAIYQEQLGDMEVGRIMGTNPINYGALPYGNRQGQTTTALQQNQGVEQSNGGTGQNYRAFQGQGKRLADY
ncbi:UNKNOWN [Stylonychia lemnae]|uniref:Uncharacterized protein n=1 Tax=Stylonychia lemnae TaxID=5949 RepID=A0A077ZUI2_STYLE|nr:UNKNOWN [Stylonychia lemnae]|eukprot:CDW73532.1 UNKNOWN [Stylonychia lemnae]